MKSLIIIDIQPFYHQYHSSITPKLLNYLNQRGKNYENILWFFNAEDQYMNAIDEDVIKYVVKHMIREDVTDSRDLEEEDLKMLFQTYHDLSEDDMEDWSEEYDTITNDNIHIPNFKWGAIKNLKNVDICGGGRKECLAEMEILLESVGVSVDRLEQFIYG